MARQRETPRCPFCHEIIAEGVYLKQEDWQPPFIGDTFIEWKYLPHSCEKENKKNRKIK